MARDVITTTEIQAGKPTTTSLFNKIKGNDDDHETRINAVEVQGNRIVIFDEIVVNAAQYNSGTGIEEIGLWRSPISMNITQAVIHVLEAGTSGTWEYDLKKSSTLGGVFASMFTTKPSVVFSAGDNVSSSNAVFSDNSVSQGDFIKLDLTGLQSPARRIQIEVYGDAT